MKKLTVTILALTFAILLPSTVLAYVITERDELGFDNTLSVKDQEVYAFPEKILVTQISGAPTETSANSESWINMLYYHFITRLEFADIPYNYIVDRDGNVFKGRSGWDGVIPELKEKEGAILIGYLSEGNDLTVQSKEALTELVEEISYIYGLSEDSVVPVEVTLALKEDGQLGKLTYSTVENTFSNNITAALPDMKFARKQHIDVSAEVLDVDFPESVGASEEFEVTFKLKNTGEVPLFTFNDYLYVMTSDQKNSQFAINGEWDDFNTPTHIEGETIFPEDDVEVAFKMRAPLFPGEYVEEFGVKRITDSSVLGDTKFEVTVNVDKGDMKLVEILPTGTGTLNVRETPSAGGRLLGQVAEGEILIMVEKGSGWYKVQYDGEEEGWVFGQYVKEIE